MPPAAHLEKAKQQKCTKITKMRQNCTCRKIFVCGILSAKFNASNPANINNVGTVALRIQNYGPLPYSFSLDSDNYVEDVPCLTVKNFWCLIIMS